MQSDTICAISSAHGKGAIAVIRISGHNSIDVLNKIYSPYGKKETSKKLRRRVSVGQITDGTKFIDEVVVNEFYEPHSYTGENLVEISCHGSTYIQNYLIELLIKNECRIANKGEFTYRAFMNKKLDLSQAEAVSELISSKTSKSHELALKQMRGGISSEIKILRDKLIKFASLIELELDFSQEDVEFADRKELMTLLDSIKFKILAIIKSFKYGNAIKNGVPISIVGQPNSGKSTLLNKILNEERSIVSDIEGTTRDTIEEMINYNGIEMRFIDTAGIRNTDDKIEKIGISRTYEKISSSLFILYLIDRSNYNSSLTKKEIQSIKSKISDEAKIIVLLNKFDLNKSDFKDNFLENFDCFDISAKKNIGVEKILKNIEQNVINWNDINSDIVITNQRHYSSLTNTISTINEIEKGLESKVSGEFLSIDIKKSLEYLGEISGEISNEDLLDSIFRDFCIGK